VALHEFLDDHRSKILQLTQHKIAEQSSQGSSPELIESLPEMLDEVVAALREDVGLERETTSTDPANTARVHGRRRLRLGFTMTELVHDYGALCQAITTLAEESSAIRPHEYQILSQALDTAIAEAVSEYAAEREVDRGETHALRATKHLGCIVHELRNALAAATMSFEAIKSGEVAICGRTGHMLERSLKRAQDLIDRSLAEVRLRSGIELACEPTSLRDLLEDVEITTTPDAKAKHTHVVIAGASPVQLEVDRALITSALANLVQNAIKYSPADSEIHVHCTVRDNTVTIEIEDRCGGLPEDRVDGLFDPFVRGDGDTSGLGLGLPITRQAIEAHGGHVHVHNVPGTGCVFVCELPR
jgi:signal transduction histidine kinase